MTMRTNEELLQEILTADDGSGPIPLTTYRGDALREIMALVEERVAVEGRITEAVNRARAEGATWAMVGLALGVTRQGALKHYRDLAGAA